jgi:hypothetical protein
MMKMFQFSFQPVQLFDLIIPHDSTRAKFAEATAVDTTSFLNVLRRGWPDRKFQVSSAI